jgi:hypothetical protein
MNKTLYVLACALCTLLVLPAAAQVPAYVPTDGLVGWWPFNGNANDESGNGNDGVMVGGISNADDRFGNSSSAFLFDGISGYIDLPSLNNQPYTPITYSAWVIVNSYFPSSFGHKFRSIIGRNTAFVLENGVIGFYADNNANGGSYDNNFTMWRGGGQTGPTPFSDSLPLLNEWTHIAYTQNAEGDWKWYINGILTNSGNFTDLQNDYNYFQIGGCNNSTGNYFWNDKLDDIGLWNRALTEQEIQNLYSGTTPPPCVSLPSNLQQGLVGYWPFCGNANDESGNGNDGVVNGATLTEDRFGNANAAYGFDGVDDIIPVPFQTIQMNSDYSISAWIQPSEYVSPYPQVLWSDSNNGVNNEYSFRMQLDSMSRSILYFMEIGASNTGTVITSENDQINEGNYYHILISTDATTTSMYINNNLVQTTERITPTIFSDSIFIGHYGGFFGYQGVIDDIGIWNRALTPEEVQELYTLDACTFTVYDTLTVYETVYDTVYTYETIYDTVTTYVTVTDTLLIDITFTGFEGQPSWLNTVTVFPNPASDHITIDYGNFALMAGYNTIITDAAGATVYSSAVNSQQVEIDINAWGATGVYYMSVYDANGELVAVRHIVLE